MQYRLWRSGSFRATLATRRKKCAPSSCLSSGCTDWCLSILARLEKDWGDVLQNLTERERKEFEELRDFKVYDILDDRCMSSLNPLRKLANWRYSVEECETAVGQSLESLCS